MSTEAAIGRDLWRPFDGGGVAGLTEAQLMDRVARRDDSAEAAFEAILTRHGPAVLAAAVARGLAMAAGLKAGAVVLAVVSLISAGAGLVALAGRDNGPPSQPGSPQGEPAARAGAPAVDRYGDPLPKGAIARLGTTRFRHGDGFPRVFFAPDGKTLITARGEARVWDVATGRLLRSFDAGWVVVPSPDGRTLFAAGYGFLRAIDGFTGRELRRVALGPSVLPDRLAISPDGKGVAVLIGSRNQMHRQKDLSSLILLDASTLAARWRIEKDPPYAEELAFSADRRPARDRRPCRGSASLQHDGAEGVDDPAPGHRRRGGGAADPGRRVRRRVTGILARRQDARRRGRRPDGPAL